MVAVLDAATERRRRRDRHHRRPRCLAPDRDPGACLQGAPTAAREMLAGMANCAWAVLEHHRDRGWQIIDYNAQTLPEPHSLADYASR